MMLSSGPHLRGTTGQRTSSPTSTTTSKPIYPPGDHGRGSRLAPGDASLGKTGNCGPNRTEPEAEPELFMPSDMITGEEVRKPCLAPQSAMPWPLGEYRLSDTYRL